MRITSRTNGNINGIILTIGSREYPGIDHKDPNTAAQLRILRDEVGTISFDEIIEGDRVAQLKGMVKAEEFKKLSKKKGGFKDSDAIPVINEILAKEKAAKEKKEPANAGGSDPKPGGTGRDGTKSKSKGNVS